MTKRQVRQPLMSYRDDEGLLHHGLQGTTVDVGDAYLKDFDAVNDPERRSVKQAAKAAAVPSPTAKKAPKKQATPRRK